MDILFWNIGKTLSKDKTISLNEIIDEKDPDFVCIAEGSGSIDKCNDLINIFINKGYSCYYNPLFYKTPLISRQYGWNNLGLKVFVKMSLNFTFTFSFDCQKFDGRILYLPIDIKGKLYSIFFIHNKSQVGDPFDQRDFIIELSSFIKAKSRNSTLENVVILGDFNIEPWNELISRKDYINSFFHKKWYEYSLKRNSILKTKIYYNPFFDLLISNPNKDMVGTFFNKNFYSLIDFALFSSEIKNYSIEVITQILSKELLIKKGKKNLLVSNFDHLPIFIKLK